MNRELVVGFLFDKGFTHVALIRKLKPARQAGRLNGIGGKVEPGEAPLAAMRREFMEEAGLDIEDWNLFNKMTGPNGTEFSLYFYWAVGDVHAVRTMEAEHVSVVPVATALSGALQTLGNLPWLVALARAIGQGEEGTLYFNIEEAVYREGGR
jgi:8-oxo-dGTP diphosphatase